ncbi:tape measure protein [Stutzerimonas stutzeri]|uniref:tape measure protein n=1 Tax=Stutzerimonas stutzeri TaxID=316 RepID=UPI000F767BA2|nr:tape measure protein [Stutzerimonas stutzeri]MDH0728926.1 tape measure protein [Stutzerimonas stutzeri]
MEIAKYTVGLNFSLNPRSIRMVDQQIRLMEKKLALMTQRMKANFDKSFALPSLKIKKIELDPLSAQRSIQGDLNRMGRLLELKVGNIRLDQAKINAQVQTTFQRAANQARMNVKTIAGAGGGGNPFPAVPRFNTLGAAGLGGGLGASLPMFGPAGIAAAAVVGTGAYGVSKINDARRLISQRELERLQLEISVGGSEERRQSAVDVLIDLSNKLGVQAQSQVDGFTRFMKQGQNSMGLTARRAFDLYSNMGIATRGNGGDQQSIERQSLALTQIGGLGYLRAEELNTQLADSNPAIRSYIIKAWEERTGAKGVEAFLSAMAKRQVSFNDVMRGYELAAKEASGRVKELANTVQGEEARLANARFAEELERSKGPMTDAARRFVESQQKLFEASEPLRDSFYKVAAAGTSLAADMVGWLSTRLQTAPALNNEVSNEQRATDPFSSAMGRGMLSVPDIRRIRDNQAPFISPLVPESPAWKQAADSFVMPRNLLQQMSGASINSTVTVQPGAINITAHGVSEEKLVGELEGRVQGIFRHEMQSLLSSTKLEYSQKE